MIFKGLSDCCQIVRHRHTSPFLDVAHNLGVQYKTAFVLAHKLREAMSAEQPGIEMVDGEVEVDGAFFGGHVRPQNRKLDRRDRRKKENQSGKRKVVVIARERRGRTITMVRKREVDAVEAIQKRISPGTVVYADEASGWDDFHIFFGTHRINHAEAYSAGEASTNWAESFFSRVRRAKIGIHHHVAGPYLAADAAEVAWREDYRRSGSRGKTVRIVAMSPGHGVSRQWKGYWQRNKSETWINETMDVHQLIRQERTTMR